MPETRFTRLLPDAGAIVDATAWIESLAFEPPASRPHVVVNFVASADGRAQVDGRSGALGDAGDKALFHALRERVDAVLAGTGTLRAERYGRILGKPERRARRIAAGRSPEPLAVTISRSGEVPIEIPLFAELEARVVVFGSMSTDPGRLDADVRVEPFSSLAAALETLRVRDGVETLLCEGGPTLFAALLEAGLVDELFLTLAPRLVGGGEALAITEGPALPAPAELDLRSAYEREGTLFLRYAVRN